MKRAREPSAAGREDAGEHAAPCYHQPHLGRSPARGPAPARRVSAGPAGPTLSRAVLQLGPSTSDPASAVARVLLSEWPYRGPRGSPGRPQPSSAVRLLFGTFSGSVRSWAPLLPARVLGACHSVPSAIRLTFTSVPVALSPWNCPLPFLPQRKIGFPALCVLRVSHFFKALAWSPFFRHNSPEAETVEKVITLTEKGKLSSQCLFHHVFSVREIQ